MDTNITIPRDKKVHFIGIGGCSMSGLAQIMHANGYQVTGSDMKESAFTRQLAKKGIPVTFGHDEKNVRGAGLVVYTAAIKPYNPCLLYTSRCV